MAKRISRAKQQLRSVGVRFDLPPAAEGAGRLQVVLHVLYLVVSEGYTSSSGPDVQRADLITEAIRLARLLPSSSPPTARSRGCWRCAADRRPPCRADHRRRLPGAVGRAAARPVGHRPDPGGRGAAHPHPWHRPGRPLQLQAAIAAVHDEAPSDADTDWPQILALYQALELVAPGPAVTLNRAVAVAPPAVPARPRRVPRPVIRRRRHRPGAGGRSIGGFQAMFEGRDPTTGKLLGRTHGRNGVPAFEVVLRPTKSVSILYGLDTRPPAGRCWPPIIPRRAR
jgi:hypothetical protein